MAPIFAFGMTCGAEMWFLRRYFQICIEFRNLKWLMWWTDGIINWDMLLT